jgi:D-serine deaminase-like pyridoxal phosphate-dependent protein
MTSRRAFFTAGAAALSAAGSPTTRSAVHYRDLEARIARRDLRSLSKEDLPTPCLIVDLAILESNLRTMAEQCRSAGTRLRGHVKVHKSPEIARRQVALGAIGVTCATVAECELMSRSGIPGALLTRQAAGKNAIGRLIALAKRDPGVGTVVDDPLAVEWLQDAAASERVRLGVAVDVFAGMTRHGIERGEPALELARKVDRSRSLKLVGFMGYSGGASHTRGWEARREKSRQDLAGLAETVAMGRKAGLPVEIVSGGSTGTYNIDTEDRLLTELQAGSFVFMDTLYRQIGGKDDPAVYRDFGHALTMMATVISKRRAGQCTIDAGNKSMLRTTDEVKDHPEVRVLNQGAEYGILAWDSAGRDFKLGERVELYPTLLDMTTNVFERYYVTRGEQVIDVWPIMGRGGAAQR